MQDQEKSREQLIEELEELRRRVAPSAPSRRNPGDRSGPWDSSDPHWHSLVASTPVFLLILDHDHRICFANHTDSGAEPEELIGKPAYTFLRPEDRDYVRERVERVFQTGRPDLVECRGLRLDGQEHWYASNLGPIFADGKVTAVSVITINVTASKQAEESVRQSEQRLRLHVEQTPLAVIEWDLEMRVAKWNRGAVRIFGYTEQEALGRRFEFLVPLEAREHTDHLWAALLHKQGGERSTNQNLTRDGRLILCEWYNTPLVNAEGQVIGIASLAQDITQRQRAETALRASETKYRRLHQTMMDAFVSVTMDGRVQEFNDAYCQLLGYEPQELQVLTYVDLTPAKWHEFEARIVREQILPRGYSDIYEKEYRRKDGRIVPVELRTFLIHDDNHQPSAMWAIVRDITARKRAEEEIQEANSRLDLRVKERTAELTKANAELQTIYDRMVDGLLIVDIETKGFAKANRAIGQMLGYSPEELVSMSVKDIHPQEALPVVLAAFQSQGEERSLRADSLPMLRRDGSVFFADSTANHIVYNGRPCLIGFFRDVTERRQAEQTLAESEEKYRHLVETTDTGFLILDEQGRVVDANAEYVRISGHNDLREILGRSVVEWTAPYDAERNAAEVARCLTAGIVRRLEVDYIRDDGTIIPIEVNASIVNTSQGRRVLALCRDITERKQVQEMLRKQNDLLRRALLASDHERRSIAYEIHDSFLQQVAGATMQFEAYEQFRQQRRSRAAAEAFEEGMNILRESQAEARRLIRGVRPLALDQSSVVVVVTQFIQGFEGKPGPRIEFHCQVEFDRLQQKEENAIYRMIQEGVTNARRHSRSEQVRVELVQHGDRIRILIQDWGIGFDQAKTGPHSFGLESIRERAKMLGGEARIETAAGQGTRITVELPLLVREDDD